MWTPLGEKRGGEFQKWMSKQVANAALSRLSRAHICRVPLAEEGLRKRPRPSWLQR